MSKMDDLRAMREANFAAHPPRTARATSPAKRAPAKKAPEPATTPTSAGSDDTRRCGHRAISGRSCTREHGHEEKSHRYG